MAQVAELVRHRTGLVFPEIRVRDVEATIRRAMTRRGIASPRALLQHLDVDSKAREEVVAELTIGETYFFRDPGQLQLLRDNILPEALRTRHAMQQVRIWSAGCASGEEAYSVAMLLDRMDALDRADIVGTDIARARLEHAQRGIYSRWSLRATPQEDAERWFTPRGRYFELDARIRDGVDYRYLNLAEDSYPSLSTGIWGMDVILCRNVLIYFDEPTVVRVASRLLASLAEDGWLILGASDPAIAELVACDVVVTPAGLAYRRPGAAGDAALARFDFRVVQSGGPETMDPPEPVLPADEAAPTGMDTDSFPAPDATAELPSEAPAEPELSAAISSDSNSNSTSGANGQSNSITAAYAARDHELTRRLAEAESRKRALADAEWAAWLRALANDGCLEEALRVATQARGAVAGSAELHYLHAVLLLQAGDAPAALEAARRALYLDRSYAVAHLTMAEAQRRMGRRGDAVRSLRNAAAVLATLDADAEVAGADGEQAGRMADLVRVKLNLLEAA